jgi:hypothetical protein
MSRWLSAWILRRALGAARAETVLGDLNEETSRSGRRRAWGGGLQLLWRAAAFAAAVRWAERSPRPRVASGVWQDLRFALRALRFRPFSSLAAAGLLALAIGITTAMFTIVDALLVRPVPFADAEGLKHLSLGGSRGGPLSVPADVYHAWRERHAFAALEAVATSTRVLDSPPASSPVPLRVSPRACSTCSAASGRWLGVCFVGTRAARAATIAS